MRGLRTLGLVAVVGSAFLFGSAPTRAHDGFGPWPGYGGRGCGNGSGYYGPRGSYGGPGGYPGGYYGGYSPYGGYRGFYDDDSFHHYSPPLRPHIGPHSGSHTGPYYDPYFGRPSYDPHGGYHWDLHGGYGHFNGL